MLFAIGSAHALDSEEAAIPLAGTQAYSWAGTYVGVQGGISKARGDWSLDPAYALGESYPRFSGGELGAHAGILYQIENNFVFGAEIDLQRSFGNSVDVVTSYGVVSSITLETDLKWAASARLRAGYALGNWLPYVTGGIAVADYEVVGSNLIDTRMMPHSPLAVGWTAGLGVAYALSDELQLKGEYRYTNYGGDARGAIGNPDTFKFETQQLTLGISYKF
jgi:outer membrane immunogenic protein